MTGCWIDMASCITSLFCYILYFAWEDQSDAAYRILHTILISCITVLYESYRTVKQLIGKMQYSYVFNWANTIQL